MKDIKDLEEEYDLELDKIIKKIKSSKAKLVLLQFPDGLKPYATSIVTKLEKLTNNKVRFLIWLGSCFGACDIPNVKNIDLLVQFGHSN